MAEAFVNTIKRDYVGGADLSDADTVIRQLPDWIQDYNRLAPHSALGFLSPKEFRAQQYVRLMCLENRGADQGRGGRRAFPLLGFTISGILRHGVGAGRRSY